MSNPAVTPSGKKHQPFVPEHMEMKEFTLRAVLLGLLMTVVLGAANAYLGLRAGITIAATYPAAVGLSRGGHRGPGLIDALNALACSAICATSFGSAWLRFADSRCFPVWKARHTQRPAEPFAARNFWIHKHLPSSPESPADKQCCRQRAAPRFIGLQAIVPRVRRFEVIMLL